jgi:hypothetical protein
MAARNAVIFGPNGYSKTCFHEDRSDIGARDDKNRWRSLRNS